MNWVVIAISVGDGAHASDAGFRIQSIRFHNLEAAQKAAAWLGSRRGIITHIVDDFKPDFVIAEETRAG